MRFCYFLIVSLLLQFPSGNLNAMPLNKIEAEVSSQHQVHFSKAEQTNHHASQTETHCDNQTEACSYFSDCCANCMLDCNHCAALVTWHFQPWPIVTDLTRFSSLMLTSSVEQPTPPPISLHLA